MTWNTFYLSKMAYLFDMSRQITGFGLHAKAICWMIVPCLPEWVEHAPCNDNKPS